MEGFLSLHKVLHKRTSLCHEGPRVGLPRGEVSLSRDKLAGGTVAIFREDAGLEDLHSDRGLIFHPVRLWRGGSILVVHFEEILYVFKVVQVSLGLLRAEPAALHSAGEDHLTLLCRAVNGRHGCVQGTPLFVEFGALVNSIH